jgi:hypothetical protein
MIMVISQSDEDEIVRKDLVVTASKKIIKLTLVPPLTQKMKKLAKFLKLVNFHPQVELWQKQSPLMESILPPRRH